MLGRADARILRRDARRCAADAARPPRAARVRRPRLRGGAREPVRTRRARSGAPRRAAYGRPRSRLRPTSAGRARAWPAGVAIGITDDEKELRALASAYVGGGLPAHQGEDRAGRRHHDGCRGPGRSGRRHHARGRRQRFVRARGRVAPRALDRFALQCLEQPLPPDALRGHAELSRRIATPIALDESVTSATIARDAIALGSCRVVNIKPGRVGGVHEAKRVHDACVDGATPALIGGMLETGIGRAVNVALASLPGFTEAGDLSASDRYFAEDVTEPWALVNGCLSVPDAPGHRCRRAHRRDRAVHDRAGDAARLARFREAPHEHDRVLGRIRVEAQEDRIGERRLAACTRSRSRLLRHAGLRARRRHRAGPPRARCRSRSGGTCGCRWAPRRPLRSPCRVQRNPAFGRPGRDSRRCHEGTLDRDGRDQHRDQQRAATRSSPRGGR